MNPKLPCRLVAALFLAGCAAPGRPSAPTSRAIQDRGEPSALDGAEAEQKAWGGSLDVLFGPRLFDEETFGNDGDQLVTQLALALRRPESPWALDLGVARSAEAFRFRRGFFGGRTRNGSSSEASIGALYDLELDRSLRAYAGAGLSLVRGSIVERDSDGDHRRESDRTSAAYGRLGAYVLRGRVRVGIDYRRLFGGSLDLDLDGDDADYEQITLFLGIAF